MKEKELNSIKKRKIIENYLQILMSENPSFYYSPAAEIAREIHLKIRESLNRMPVEEQALVRKLTIRNIEIILSIKK